MIHVRRCFAVILAIFLLTATAFAEDANVTGTWSLDVETPKGIQVSKLTLAQQGGIVTGTYDGVLGKLPVKGTIKGKLLSVDMHAKGKDYEFPVNYTAIFDGATAKGTMTMGKNGTRPFLAKKIS